MSPENYFPDEQGELWKLIHERSLPAAPVEEVDRRIWEQFGDEGAIMFTDLAGFTARSAQLGITHFLQTILHSQKVLRPVIHEHDGVVFDVVGDSMLIWFKPIERAIRCAIAMQLACQQFNERREAHDQVLLCLGIGYGRVLRVGSARLAGRELNVASKLGEDCAQAYDILVSQSAKQAGESLLDVEFNVTEITLPGCPEVYRIRYESPRG